MRWLSVRLLATWSAHLELPHKNIYMPPTTLSGLVNLFLGLINLIIPLIFALIFLFLVWKVIDSWILHADDERKRAEGKQYAVTAVIVMVILTIIWGIIAMLRSSIFGV